MRRNGKWKLAMTLVATGVLVGMVGIAFADDESSDTAIEVRAPLDSIQCTAPALATILGLTFDIATADGGGGEAGDDDGDGADCAALIPGQMVEVELLSDASPLVAAEIQAAEEPGIELKGPLQGIDASAMTVTILGATIDISAAEINGADDNGDDDIGTQAIDLAQLVVGQIVEAELDPARLPALVATEIELKNFTNQVVVTVVDEDGTEVEDVEEDGTEVEDVDVLVTQAVRATVGGVRVKKPIEIHKLTNGSFVLTGLAAGRVKIDVTRNHSGVISSRRVGTSVRPNSTRSITAKLRRPR